MSDDVATRMTSHRPYLLRALYAWIVDNGMTPHLLVDATRSDVVVPPSAVNEGRVVLNVAERAVVGLEMGNDSIAFTARFGGVSQSVYVPVSAVLAIYARENGQGMALPEDHIGPPGETAVEAPSDTQDDDGSHDDGGGAPNAPRRGGHLRVVK